MRQRKPSQAHRIAALLDDYRPHCSNEMRQMSIADPPRRINDLEEEGYIIKKEYCTMHSYHDGLPKMYTLVSKPDKTNRNQLSQPQPPQVEQRAVQEESPRSVANFASQPISRGYAYSRTEPEVCCQIFKVSGFTHSQGCQTQKVTNT